MSSCPGAGSPLELQWFVSLFVVSKKSTSNAVATPLSPARSWPQGASPPSAADQATMLTPSRLLKLDRLVVPL
jgi:hypothetical protein